jgi:putative flippase GtrA
MIKRLSALVIQRRQFLTYAAIGGSGALLDYIVFLALLHSTSLHYLLINSLSTSVGIVNNFTLNCWFNFKVRDRLFIRFAAFYAVGLVGLGVASLLLYLEIDVAGLQAGPSKLATLIAVLLVQYNLNRLTSFRESTRPIV